MRLQECFAGQNAPFEGDLVLWLHSLPEGAHITQATATLAPVGGGVYPLTFDDAGSGGWGATREPPTAGAQHWAVADFHARRGLSAVRAARNPVGPASVQIDVGGVWMGLAADGTPLAPDKPPLWLLLESDVSEITLPPLSGEKIKLTAATKKDDTVNPDITLTLCGVTLRSVPTNVSARVGTLPPFWTHLGALTGPVTSPDFAAVLNAFLQTAAAENGFYALPFTFHSDTIAALAITVTLEYALKTTVLPAHLPEASLTYDLSTQAAGEQATLLQVRAPRGARIVSAEGHVRGSFESSRLTLGAVGALQVAGALPVTASQSLAQPFEMANETPASSMDLPLTCAAAATLQLALQSDADGKPSGEVLLRAELRLESAPPGDAGWRNVKLPTTYHFLPGRRYWLVLQSLEGEADWTLQSDAGAAPGLQRSTDGGFSWRTVNGGGAAGFRLRHTPQRFSVPVQLQVGADADAQTVRLDAFAPLGRIEFAVDFGAALDTVLSSPAMVSPCGAGNLLANADFALPGHDDASWRLFGFGARSITPYATAYSAQLEGEVALEEVLDLSRERTITLAIDDGEPVCIHCAGLEPARTHRDEVIAAINRAMKASVASYGEVEGQTGVKRLIIRSPTDGPSSAVHLHAWCRYQLPQHWNGVPNRVLRLRNPGSGQLQTLLIAPSTVAPPEEKNAMRAARVVARAPAPTSTPPPSGFSRVVVTPSPEPTAPAEIVAERSKGAAQAAEWLSACFATATEETAPLASETPFLAQRVAVSGGCTYALRLEATPHRLVETLTPALWRVIWFDAGGVRLEATQGVLRPQNEKDRRIALTTLTTAPPQAVQAEVRLEQPAPGALEVQTVTFTPTCERLINSVFPPVMAQAPVGWTEQRTPEQVTFIQRAAIKGGAAYTLRFQTVRTGPPGDTSALPEAQRTRVELHWLSGESALGAPALFPLDGPDFPSRAWRSEAPPQATHAEIRWIKPQGAEGIALRWISLTQDDVAVVPLNFLSEAPGTLTVSGFNVTYEPPPLPDPIVTSEQQLLEAQYRAHYGQMVAPMMVMKPAPQATTFRPVTRLGEQAIESIAGVGSTMGALLTEAGVKTIAELARIERLPELDSRTAERLLEVKATAELVESLQLDAKTYAVFADAPLEALLFAAPEALAARVSLPLSEIAHLLRELRALRLLLKNETFRQLRLGDLIA